jgi:hypothetical protein
MKMIHVQYHSESDGWWADSVDLPGWTAVAESYADLRTLAREGVHEFVGRDALIFEAEIQTMASDSLSGSGSSYEQALISGLFGGVTLSFAQVLVPGIQLSTPRSARRADVDYEGLASSQGANAA